MINGFGSAKEQWFSSFMLQVEANCSWHRLFVDQPGDVLLKGPDFEYMKARREEGRYPRCGVRPRVSQL
ncbi:hypothetical protein [Klebsiella pneumoniae]|uniref:hypothetical protein n=1 Tax=Klebsiella pneumoniae TaxID=573 RepID=UPI00396F5EA6